MARISFIDPKSRPDLATLAAKVAGARGGRVSDLYRLLMHTPAVAEASFDFVSSLRNEMRVDERTKELALMRVAILNGVDYIVRTHVERYASAAGLSQHQIRTLADWRSSQHFDGRYQALLAYVDAITQEIEIKDE